jgi:hypothetical protein
MAGEDPTPVWIDAQSPLSLFDAARLAQSVLLPGEAIWHLALGDVALPDAKAPSWQDVKAAAGSLKDKVVGGLKTVKASEVVGGAAMLGGLLVADGVLRAIGVDDGLELPTEQAGESREAYLLVLTPGRLGEARPFSRPRSRARVRAMQHWTPESLADAPLAFTHATLRFGDRWRLTLGREPAAQSFDFWKHPRAPDNLAQVAAIAARVASLRPH